VAGEGAVGDHEAAVAVLDVEVLGDVVDEGLGEPLGVAELVGVGGGWAGGGGEAGELAVVLTRGAEQAVVGADRLPPGYSVSGRVNGAWQVPPKSRVGVGRWVGGVRGGEMGEEGGRGSRGRLSLRLRAKNARIVPDA